MQVPRPSLLLIIFVSLLSLDSVCSAPSAKAPPDAAGLQCAFYPSGYFYPRAPLTGAFGDFNLLMIWETPGPKSPEEETGIIAGRQFYSFTKMNRLAPFEFTTTDKSGDSFSFSGSFHQVCMLEEDARKWPNEVVLDGQLSKFKNGNKIGEVNVEFVYSPTVRGSKPDVNLRYPSGRTELFYATREGNAAGMRELLGRGADPNIAERGTDTTPLMTAIRLLETKKARTAVDLLLAARADVNLGDRHGMTALMHAAYEFEDHSGSLVSKLLAARANVNAADTDGTTVLMHMISGATQEAALIKNVRRVLAAGANPNARDKQGRTAMSVAQEDESKPIIELLKAAGAKP